MPTLPSAHLGPALLPPSPFPSLPSSAFLSLSLVDWISTWLMNRVEREGERGKRTAKRPAFCGGEDAPCSYAHVALTRDLHGIGRSRSEGVETEDLFTVTTVCAMCINGSTSSGHNVLLAKRACVQNVETAQAGSFQLCTSAVPRLSPRSCSNICLALPAHERPAKYCVQNASKCDVRCSVLILKSNIDCTTMYEMLSFDKYWRVVQPAVGTKERKRSGNGSNAPRVLPDPKSQLESVI
eukprot:6192183-Pleurochrysis_carterae.AAC.1